MPKHFLVAMVGADYFANWNIIMNFIVLYQLIRKDINFIIYIILWVISSICLIKVFVPAFLQYSYFPKYGYRHIFSLTGMDVEHRADEVAAPVPLLPEVVHGLPGLLLKHGVASEPRQGGKLKDHGAGTWSACVSGISQQWWPHAVT